MIMNREELINAALEHQSKFKTCDDAGTLSGFTNGMHKQSYESFITGAEWQSKQSPWISVEDAIPNKQAKGMCQVKFVDGSIDEMAMREVNKWIYPYIKTGYVTHWKPIPSFDEILEANKDVLERIKEKGD